MTTISADPACCVADPICQLPSPDGKPSILLDRDVNKIVERKLGTGHFRLLDWNLNSLGRSNGFLGQYYTLSVTVQIDDKTKTLKFFAKTPPPVHSPQYQFLTRFDTFNKEITAYSEIFTKMGKGIGLKWVPDCYLGKNNVIIVLEDAKVEGYVTPDKYVPFDEEHCVWVVRALSIFHSRSLILDEKLRRSSGRTIQDLYGHLLKEVLFVEHDERSKRALSSCIKGACTLTDVTEGLKDEERTIVKERIGQWCQKLPRLLEPSSKFRNIICHRDVWANNLMFKHDSEGKPIGCYIIDYQFLRYCPPAYDFAFCLYLTTDRATRDRYFDSLAEIYHDSMRQQLTAEGLDIEDCLPRSTFLESCQTARHLGLVYAVMNLQVMLLSGQVIEEYFEGTADRLEEVLYGDKRGELVIHQFRTVAGYRTRLNEIIIEIRDRLPDRPVNF